MTADNVHAPYVASARSFMELKIPCCAFTGGTPHQAPSGRGTAWLQVDMSALKADCKFEIIARIDYVYWQTGWTISGSTNSTTVNALYAETKNNYFWTSSISGFCWVIKTMYIL